MNPSPTSSNWIAWLRNAVILGALGVAAVWSVGDWFLPPVSALNPDVGVADADMEEIQRLCLRRLRN